MKIDRERFLVLVSLLAGGACAQTQSSDPAAPGPAAPTAVMTVASVTTIPLETAAPPVATTPPPAPPPAATPKASPDPYKGTPVTAQACNPSDNMVAGGPYACNLRAPGPTCESFKDTVQECPTLQKLLKPRVASAALECLKRKSGTKEICEFNITSICAYEALGSACLDPSVTRACDGIMNRCGGPKGNYNKMSRESCEAGVSGIADSKRKKFISCISESCRFETCLTYL